MGFGGTGARETRPVKWQQTPGQYHASAAPAENSRLDRIPPPRLDSVMTAAGPRSLHDLGFPELAAALAGDGVIPHHAKPCGGRFTATVRPILRAVTVSCRRSSAGSNAMSARENRFSSMPRKWRMKSPAATA